MPRTAQDRPAMHELRTGDRRAYCWHREALSRQWPLYANVTVRTIPAQVNLTLNHSLSLSLLLSSAFYYRFFIFFYAKSRKRLPLPSWLWRSFLLLLTVQFCNTYPHGELSAFFETNSTTSLRLPFLDEIPTNLDCWTAEQQVILPHE